MAKKIAAETPGAFYANQFHSQDNPAAHYTVTSAAGRVTASVDENQFTNDWAPLGVYRTTPAGALTVRLDNSGTTGDFVAADAIRLLPQANS